MLVLRIKDLVVTARHGVHAHEKLNPQRFLVNIEVEADTLKASQSDDLNDTVDWSLLRQSVITTVESNSFNLMERLAQEVADVLLQDPRLTNVTVVIDKIDAYESGCPGISLTASR